MPRSVMMPRQVMVSWCCPKCGRQQSVTYTWPSYGEPERDYGDLPKCSRGCVVPFEVLDAIANWLDSLVAQGAGTEREPGEER